MALKFLNKKGWHTGSLRNIENVWKAEQKHEVEQRKLEELRKQIQDEREKDEFRQLSEQGGFSLRQEKLDFLYESGLAVGKGSSEGFKALQPPAAVASSTSAADASSSKAAVPGALFDDKPHSANDAWRKLHSDPLLLIRQREQEALARIKNNPVKMAMIKKSVVAEKNNKQDKEEKREKKRVKDYKHDKSKHGKHSRHHSDTEDARDDQEEKRSDCQKSMQHEGMHWKDTSRRQSDSDAEEKRKSNNHLINEDYHHRNSKHGKHSLKFSSDSRREVEYGNEKDSQSEHQQRYTESEKHSFRAQPYSKYTREGSRKTNRSASEHHRHESGLGIEDKNRGTSMPDEQPGYSRRGGMPKMSEEERATRLREMQMDAELHEEQRSKRLKRAAEADMAEASRAKFSSGKNFLDATQKSMYGTEKGGSATIEESVRRRAYYSQGSSAAHETNAFRR